MRVETYPYNLIPLTRAEGRAGLNLNQITVGVTDVDAAILFYQKLGLRLIVHTHDAYARFECPDGEATFSVHEVDKVVPGTTLIYFEVEYVDAVVTGLKDTDAQIDLMPTDQRWLWREARIRDPFGNPICIYQAGENRRFPPWRKADA